MKVIKNTIGNLGNKPQRSTRAWGNKYETMRCTAAAGLKKKWEYAIPAIPTRLDGWENQNGFHIQTIFKLK